MQTTGANQTWRDYLPTSKAAMIDVYEERAAAARISGIPFFSVEISSAFYDPSIGEIVSVITESGWEFVTVVVPNSGFTELLFKRVV